jgi:hypothetical protein
MTKHELHELANRLTQLADALNGKPPSPAGLLVWLDALGELPLATVLAVLSDWPKANSRMPVPADILKLGRDRVSNSVEKRSERDKQTPGFSVDRLNPNSPIARAELAKIQQILKQPRGMTVSVD